MSIKHLDPTRLLHTWTGELTVLGVRALAQACLYSADVVLLPSSVTIDECAVGEERAFIESQLGRLIEIGAIQAWGVEGVHPGPVAPRETATIIPRDRYRELYSESLDLLMRRRSFFLGGERVARFDGVTELVVGKHAIMHSLLAAELSASAILHDKDSADGYARFLTDLLNPTGLVAQIANSVSIELDLPEASALPDEVYEEARSKLHHFRAYVLARLRESGPILLDDAAIGELRSVLVRDVIEAYNNYVASRSTKAMRFPWLRDLWHVRRLGSTQRDEAKNEPLQVLYELKHRTRF